MSIIIQLMQAMGYEDVDTGGVCFGLAQGLIQAHLYDEKDWNEIHKMLASLQPDQIKKLVGDKKAIDAEGPLYLDTGAIKQAEERKRVRLLYDNLCEEDDMGKKKALLMFLNDSSEVSLDFRSGEEINQEKIEAIKQNLNTEIKEWKSVPISKKYGLPEEFTDERLSEVRAFLETVYMYHQGYIKEKDFSGPNSVNQHSQVDLYIDKLLEEEKLIASRVYCHNKDVFTKLLRSMEDIAAPVGFEIRLTGHTMGLVYNGNGNWTLVDHDILGAGSTEKIAGYLFERFNMSVDSCGDGDEKSIIYGLIAYAKPQYGASDSNKSQLEGCQQIMDGWKGFNIDQIPEGLDGGYLLLIAAKTGDIKTTQECIDAKFDINKEDKNGMTALLHACKRGHYEIAKLLIANGAKKDKEDNEGMTALIYACRKGQYKIAKLLIESKVKEGGERKELIYALTYACKRGHYNVAELLMDNMNESNKEGKNSHINLSHSDQVQVSKEKDNTNMILLSACLKGDEEVVKFLLDRRAKVGHKDKKEAIELFDIDIADEHGVTALAHACGEGHYEIAKLLIDNGAKEDKKDKYGMTALAYACGEGHYEIAKLLTESNIEESIERKDIVTALMYACKRGHGRVAKLLVDNMGESNKENIKRDIKSLHSDEIKVAAEKNNTDSTLIYACFHGYEEVVRFLLDRRANVNHKDKNGGTALMYACRNGNEKVVRCLLDGGAKLDQKDKGGETALMYACIYGHEEVIRILLDRGVKVNQRNKKGETALMMATREGNEDITDLLIDKEIELNPECADEKSRLAYAIERRYFPFALKLIDKGVKITRETRGGINLLFYAIREENIKAIRQILSGEDDVVSEILYGKKDGKTPMEYAIEKNSFGVTVCLLDAELKLDKAIPRQGKLKGVNIMKGKSIEKNRGKKSDGIGDKEGSQRTPGGEEDEIGLK
ncbi:MAG: ankyrin repeat domain-containing protein [Pseudomonadota bacterium]|nr:ankyrin repeat domain-containing protein [Pseudomonadota bacterium]